MVFYHGGKVNNISDIDIFRKGVKQQTKFNDYVGFYMYAEEDKDKALRYALQNDGGILKLELDDDLNIYYIEEFASINRLTPLSIKVLIEIGYDLAAGPSVWGTEYVLLNKAKIKDFTFESASKIK